MSTQIPFRRVRTQALHRQCLFVRPQTLHRPFAVAASRSLSSTPSCAAQKKGNGIQNRAQLRGGAANHISPAPRVNMEKVQQESDTGGMSEDIGVLQGTIIRAPMRKVGSLVRREFWDYHWSLVKSKLSAMYSRSVYHRMMYKTGWFRWLPHDWGNKGPLTTRAKKLYDMIHTDFAAGDVSALKPLCLPPLYDVLSAKVAARGPVAMTWTNKKFTSARIVSHRASPLGEQNPDTAYRQVVVRLASIQTMHSKSTANILQGKRKQTSVSPRHWKPDEVKGRPKMKEELQESVKLSGAEQPSAMEKPPATQKVVEYLVLQTRVIHGVEEPWKVWGFTEETTPRKMEEDRVYWSQMLDVQTAGA